MGSLSHSSKKVFLFRLFVLSLRHQSKFTQMIMFRHLIAILVFGLSVAVAHSQETLKKVYDENTDPMVQIDDALVRAKAESKFVICQVGGNWCPWCLRFADFVEKDSAVSRLVAGNFVYLHVNYNPRKKADETKTAQAAALMKRLGNPARFGFPVFVFLDSEGHVIHIQDSSFLEEGNGYDTKKVIRAFANWTPKAVQQ